MSSKRKNRYNNKRAAIEAKVQRRELEREFWDEKGDDDERTDILPMILDMEPDEAEEDVIPGIPEKWYVLDTNLILSCVNVLPDVEDKNWREPLNFNPDIRDAHLIIPMVVYQELENKRTENSFEGLTAKIAFGRLEKFFRTPECTIGEILKVNAPVPTGWGKQMISLLPCHRDFAESLPWVPGEKDNDGRIAITALAATMAKEGLPVDGTYDAKNMLKRSNNNRDVLLLTRDKPLLGRARNYGVKVASYSFKKRKPYTGCREVEVPAEMFGQFLYKHQISREDFERYLPEELPLIANEYIIMKPANVPAESIPAFGNIARYNKKNEMLYPMRFVNHEGPVPPNARIAMSYDAMNDDKIEIVLMTGKAGVGKTHQALLHGIREVEAGRKKKIVLFATQSAENPIGILPGNKQKKMEHLVAACKSVIASYLAETDEFKEMREEMRRLGNKKAKGHSTTYDSGMTGKKDKMTKPDEVEEYSNYTEELDKRASEWFNTYVECYPHENIRGITLDDVIIIIDEAQRIHDRGKLETMSTRGGKRVKILVCGDIVQIDKATPEKLMNNGVTFFQMKYFDWPGFACVHLTDNMRGGAAGYRNRDRMGAYSRIAGY